MNLVIKNENEKENVELNFILNVSICYYKVE